MSEFAVTKDLFVNYTNYTKPLSYDEWMSCPDDHKAAVLYCQFYDTITLVWYKLVSYFVTEQDGVEEIIQYLDKNVTKIKEDSNRFTSSYIYKVAYNCLGCLCFGNRNKRMKGIADQEVYVLDTDDDFDSDKNAFLACDGGMDSSHDDEQREMLWNLVESKGHDAVVVVAELLGEEVDWTRFRKNSTKFKTISKWDHAKITDERRAEIIHDLKADLIKLSIQDEIDLLM